ncbi:DNA-binding protein (plasmid) [Arthrobacter sp. StoSoilB3]|nr:DNA-binding protein [Arthrobacter sp. StoSoilB3]
MILVNATFAVSVSDLVTGAAGFLLNIQDESTQNGGRDILVRDVALHEPGIAADYQGRIVLVTSRIPDRFALAQLLEEAGTAAALVLPPDATRDLSLVTNAHPALLLRSPWAGWSEVFRMLTRTVGAGSPGVGALQLDSLHDLAAWIAELTGASVTIEDLHSRVLAYSVVGNDVDKVRSQTILGGVVPQWRLERLMASGFLPAVWQSSDVVVREAEGEDPARMVVAFRANDETLGTIWAAFGTETDRGNLRSVLLEARETAPSLLLRQIHRDQHLVRMREAALADLLRGKVDPAVPLSMLGLEPQNRHAVIVVGRSEQHSRSIAFHLQAAAPGSTAVDVDGNVAVIIAVPSPTASTDELGMSLTSHLRRVLRSEGPQLALGRIVDSPSLLAESAVEARQILRASTWNATETGAVAELRVLTASHVDDALSLIRVSDALVPMYSKLADPLRILELYDTQLLKTLQEVLRFPGSLTAAARSLGIHSNSLRYRLGRIREVSGIDLDAYDSRVRTELALLVHDTRAAEEASA